MIPGTQRNTESEVHPEPCQDVLSASAWKPPDSTMAMAHVPTPKLLHIHDMGHPPSLRFYGFMLSYIHICVRI